MSHGFHWPSDNVAISTPPLDGTSDPQTQPMANFGYQGMFFQTEPQPCSCELTYRHLWLTHWFRLLFMRRSW